MPGSHLDFRLEGAAVDHLDDRKTFPERLKGSGESRCPGALLGKVFAKVFWAHSVKGGSSWFHSLLKNI